ncbi:Retrovirus-related Pol polyprotein from transposon RE2 [Vitis vinifera]|uniref:Retrovirus-related Pol polyprotein from transposon RE2 n=1 Tax=Vitis vinifera TaxID=29760 RepID=A0A438CBY3_VITVI|nr:Retrovirus-related Pol polyprotein from transposon RE2 [Vitis vinifera]
MGTLKDVVVTLSKQAILLLKVLICDIILPHLKCMFLIMSNLLSLSSLLLLYPCHLLVHNTTLSPHGFLHHHSSNQPGFHRDIQPHHLQFNPQGQPSCDASFPTTNTTPHISHESTIQPTISLPSPEIQPTTSVLSPNTQPNTSILVHNTTSQPPPIHSMTTRAKNNIRKPIQKLNLSTQLSHPYDVEPTIVTQALKDPKWHWAMFEEYDALVRNGTWELVPSDSSHNIVGCFHQQPRLDYHDTFSLVVKPTTVRLVLSLAVSHGWSLRQLDVNNAFLQGHLSKVVYMSQPPATAHQFSLQDLGHLSYFLGVEVIPNDHGILLSQRRYIVDLLTRTKMMDAKPIHTPLPTSLPITLHYGSSLKDLTKYRTIVVSVQYLLITRPDIAFSVNKLSQYMHQPTTEHWIFMKRLLHYLCAGNKDDFTSTSAYVVYIGRNPISWSSKKQRTVARSSTEAKYRSVAATTAKLNWVSSLLTELGVVLPQSLVIYCDNIGATNLCSNPVFHSRMKHVAIDFHFIREQVKMALYVFLMFQVMISLLMPLPNLFPSLGFFHLNPRLVSSHDPNFEGAY